MDTQQDQTNIEPKQSKDVQGILSIVFALTIVLALPGLIIGLLGASKAKAKGRSPVLSRLGWMISLAILTASIVVLSLLAKATYDNYQKQLSDTHTRMEISKIQYELEVYYSNNKYYPAQSLADLKLSREEVEDDNGNKYGYSASDCTKNTTLNNADSLQDVAKSSSSDKSCQSYTLSGDYKASSDNIKVRSEEKKTVVDEDYQREEEEQAVQDSEEEIKSLVEKVAKQVDIPDEIPTIATIKDITKLTTQPFFKDAQNGDKVLIFTEARKAVIYRESTDKVINSGPIGVTDDNANAQ